MPNLIPAVEQLIERDDLAMLWRAVARYEQLQGVRFDLQQATEMAAVFAIQTDLIEIFGPDIAAAIASQLRIGAKGN